jgi:hypothetical protein
LQIRTPVIALPSVDVINVSARRTLAVLAYRLVSQDRQP